MNKVTKEYIESRIKNVEYRTIDTSTICLLTLDTGFRIIGHSACVDPKNFNKEIGEAISYDNAFKQLWPLFGFALSEGLYKGSKNEY